METEKNSKTKVITKRMTKEQVQKKIQEDYEKDHETFEGRFRYIEKPGQKLEFRLKKYLQDNYTHYSLQDGQVYTLPRFVIDHINNEVNYKKYKPLAGLKGTETAVMAGIEYAHNGHVTSGQQMYELSKDPRCEFVPTSFLQGEKVAMLPNKIVQVVAT